LFGVDFILDGDDVWTLEVNPRYTASVEVVERMTGVKAIELHARACEGTAIEATNVQSSGVSEHASLGAHAKGILFAKQEAVISAEFAEWSLAEALREPWPTLADISPAGTPVEAGRPILTVFANADNVTNVERRLHERCIDVEQRIYG
jgi:predicted ATP-grasp superfamily ATP-dependent carboligase